ncbi:MAG: tetratricopeptide repeat protein [Gammaproteobacteria bacterium]|nr:tetratricopeptide repeat protein [Gammaproteobacteria bacterium]
MFFSKSFRFWVSPFLVGLGMLVSPLAIFAAPLPSAVKDPHYGAVLYEFYQQNYFSAAVNLLTAQQLKRLKHHDADSELLLGGLYLSYGLHSDAEKIFTKLIDDAVAPGVRDRAWFYLGKIRYQKQLFTEAETALSQVGDALDESLQEEFRILKANLLMAQEKYTEAATALQGLVEDEGEQKANYARFNLGVALIRASRENGDQEKDDHEEDAREETGMNLLREVAELKSNVSDQKALRDKANLVLGFSLIDTMPVVAKHFLQRVRLQGPFSNKALLGLGWAEVKLQRYEAALVPWEELATRERTDPAVFEALLGKGNALERLRAFPQAMQSYKNAIAIFERELDALNKTVVAVKAGRLWADLLAQVSRNEMGWFWEAELLPDTPEARYLPVVMAEHGFHEAIKNLRDLWFLDKNLGRWVTGVPALEDMLALRRATYEAQLDKLTPEQTLGHVQDVRISRDIYADELARIGETKDAFELLTGKEKKLMERLSKVEERIWQLSNQPGRHLKRLDNYRYRYRLYKGLLDYEVETTYAIRFQQVRKSLNSLDAELEETLQQQNSLQRARGSAPVNFAAYEKIISNKRQRITSLRKEIKTAFDEQQRQLQEMVDFELDILRARLVDYLDQARFSLAHLQDLAADAAESGKELK